ncbi:putative MFS family arabinose efflux permease [Nocardiopsis sp. Huas11]|uniref:MFS transporter n=1 Tax=Nocardiopsis sp. Huas11 TaxID=2183912 RepID=UPI000F2D9D82|nr:MFS transporter [Nocardiopsis sp. Huas11]RKS08997.1 putative MFS family arabinose efflux permease [Nocardiopsis sp. Huas11]
MSGSSTWPRPDDPHTGSTPPLGGRFWRLWGASGLSNLADGVLKVALPLAALRLTDSPPLIAGVTFALTVPWLLCALPAGALADRVDRRAAMLGANLARGLALTALALALASGTASIWTLYAVALCVGVAETVYDTAAQSILPQVVPRVRLSAANGRLHAAELTAQQFVGPPLGGLLVALGLLTAFAAPAGLWLVAVGALVTVGGRYRVERAAPATLRADIAEGLRFLWGHRLLRTLAVMVGVSNFATNAVFAVLVLYAVGPDSALGLTEPGYGVLMTAAAVGSLLGALGAERIERLLGRAWSLRLTVLASALLVGAPALSTSPYAVAAGFLVGGVGIAVWNVITVSLRQRTVPDALLGRVNSAYRLLAWGTMPLGAATGGLLAQLLGLRAVFAVMALLVLTLLVPMARIDRAALEDDGASGDGSR